MGFGIKYLLLLISVAFLFSGCNVVPEEVTPGERETLSLSRMETELAGPDPLEPFNRSMFAVTDFCMNYIADPIGRVYCTILPRPAIECIDNACTNLEFPARAISCLCRAEWGGALDETVRFLFNTIVGIGGLFDPARYWLHIYSTDSKFGEAFAVWGIGPGCKFVLPFSSASNVRDTVGSLFDTAFDCKTYIPYCGWATGLNRVVVAQDKYSSALSGLYDPYKGFTGYSVLTGLMGKELWGYRYRNAVRDAAKAWKIDEASGKRIPPPLEPELPVKIPEWAGENTWVDISGYYSMNPVSDSLRSVFFKEQNRNSFWYMPLSLFCGDFVCKRDIYKLKICDREMRYAFWDAPVQKDDAPVMPERLVFLLPGIGGTYMDSSPTAFAELFHLRHAKVAVINSTFSWQFNESRQKGELPGFLPEDAEVLRSVIKQVLADLKARKKIKSPEIVLAGYSFGALHTLKIADLEFEDEQLGVSRYIAVNPPVSLDNTVKIADDLISRGVNMDETEFRKRFIDAAGRIMAAGNMQLIPYKPEGNNDPRLYRINIPELESSVLVGFNLRNSMRELLLTSHIRQPIDCIRNDGSRIRKNNLYLELDRVTFRQYAEKVLAPRYPDVPLHRLYQMSDLRSISATLQNDERITVFHNIDDFLLTCSDRKFLSEKLGKRLVWFSRGGHLGNLYDSRVQNLIADTALPETAPEKEFKQKKRILQHRAKKVSAMK